MAVRSSRPPKGRDGPALGRPGRRLPTCPWGPCAGGSSRVMRIPGVCGAAPAAGRQLRALGERGRRVGRMVGRDAGQHPSEPTEVVPLPPGTTTPPPGGLRPGQRDVGQPVLVAAVLPFGLVVARGRCPFGPWPRRSPAGRLVETSRTRAFLMGRSRSRRRGPGPAHLRRHSSGRSTTGNSRPFERVDRHDLHGVRLGLDAALHGVAGDLVDSRCRRGRRAPRAPLLPSPRRPRPRVSAWRSSARCSTSVRLRSPSRVASSRGTRSVVRRISPNSAATPLEPSSSAQLTSWCCSSRRSRDAAGSSSGGRRTGVRGRRRLVSERGGDPLRGPLEAPAERDCARPGRGRRTVERVEQASPLRRRWGVGDVVGHAQDDRDATRRAVRRRSAVPAPRREQDRQVAGVNAGVVPEPPCTMPSSSSSTATSARSMAIRSRAVPASFATPARSSCIEQQAQVEPRGGRVVDSQLAIGVARRRLDGS